MNKIVLANWKACLSPIEAQTWLEAFLSKYKPVKGVEVILAVPVMCLARVCEQVGRVDGLKLASQNVSPYPPGNYTGATPASWLKGVCHYVLIGHREQRQYLHLTVQDIANQAAEVIGAGLVPIVCLERKDAPLQIAAFDHLVLDDVVMAYTPSDAEQLEIARSEKTINEAVAYLSILSGGRPVLYGGGVSLTNAGYLMSLSGVSGIMAARGCLDPLAFVDLVQNVAKEIKV